MDTMRTLEVVTGQSVKKGLIRPSRGAGCARKRRCRALGVTAEAVLLIADRRSAI